MRKQLNGKLIASLDELLRIPGCADTGRGTGQDDCTSGQGSALGEEADQLGNAEDQVTGESKISSGLFESENQTE